MVGFDCYSMRQVVDEVDQDNVGDADESSKVEKGQVSFPPPPEGTLKANHPPISSSNYSEDEFPPSTKPVPGRSYHFPRMDVSDPFEDNEPGPEIGTDDPQVLSNARKDGKQG